MEQSTIKNIAQIIVLTAISTISLLAMMAIPTDGYTTWALALLGSKAVAIAGFYTTYKLEKIWRPGNKWLQTYEQWFRGTEDERNTIYTRKGENE